MLAKIKISQRDKTVQKIISRLLTSKMSEVMDAEKSGDENSPEKASFDEIPFINIPRLGSSPKKVT